MKKSTRLLALLPVLALLLAVSGCSGGGKKFRVGICQQAPHQALDEAAQGFQDALERLLPGRVEFDVQNAGNDPAVCAAIATGFAAADMDLILANGTLALQAASSATDQIPIVGASVTAYGAALGVEDFDGTVGSNISGVSDLAPLDKQAQMIRDWLPEAKTVGLFFCSSELNSRYQADEVQRCLESLGFACRQYPFADVNDMNAVCQEAAAVCDAIYIPTDNTCAANTGIIDNVCRPAGVPVFAGEESTCRGCGVATLSVRYSDIGAAAGELAARILTGEADISRLPIAYAQVFTPAYNPVLCGALGLSPPASDYKPLA